jgi:hypothetical protein
MKEPMSVSIALDLLRRLRFVEAELADLRARMDRDAQWVDAELERLRNRISDLADELDSDE